MKKATNKILSLALVVMMLMSTFSMMLVHAEETSDLVTTPKAYDSAQDGEKLWDVDFSSEHYTLIDDTTEVYKNNGITYTAGGSPTGNSTFTKGWLKNIVSDATVIENNGTTLKVDGAKPAIGTEGEPGYVAPVASETTSTDQRYIGQINVYDLENKTYTYDFEYLRNGVKRSKVYFANGVFSATGWHCDTNMPNLGIELNNSGFLLRRQSSEIKTGVVGKPVYNQSENGEKTTRVKIVLEGGAKEINKTLVEGTNQNASGKKHWIGDVIPVTFTIYNSIVKEDGTVQDIRVTKSTLYQPADVKLVFGIGEFDNPAENQYYGVRNLAIYKGDTSIKFDFNFEKVYDYTEWGEQLAAFDPRGISNDAYNFANGYNWSTLSNGEGISVDAEGVVTINSAADKSQGAYTPHPFGNQWNLGYYELEMTVNNAHRLKLDIIKSGDQDRVGFDILPNGSASSFAGSMGDEKAYLTAGNAASLYVSAGNSFGDGVINAGGLKTIIYDKYVADANGDGIPEDPRNVRDYGANRANIKITFDCVNYIITLYEKCSSTWVATAAIDYSESVAQGLDSSLYLGFMAWNKGANVTAKNIKLLKGMSAAHLHTWSISDYTSDLYAYYDSTVPAKLATEFVTKYGLDSAKFGWTVDGKTLCKDMKAAYDNLKTTMYGPQTINLVPILVYEKIATAPVVRGIQLAHNEDNTAYSIRFISAIGDRDDFHKVGYEIKKTIKVGDQITTVTDTLETDTVYSYINVNGTKYYAEAIGGEYIVSLGYADEAVVENSEVTYEITTYYVSRDGNKVTDKNAVSITLVDGQY